MTTCTEDGAAPLLPGARKARPGRELVAEVYQALAAPIVAVLARIGAPPTAVLVTHTAIGLTAAYAIAADSPVLAAVLLQLKTLLDGVDGQLARVTERITAVGRFLDTEADLLVNACVFAALGSATGEPWLALLALCALTFVLSADHNVALLHDEVRGRLTVEFVRTGSALERGLTGIYAVVFGWQDRVVRTLSARRLGRLLARAPDAGRRERAALAYHDRATATVLANAGLSTQLLALGVCLVADVPVLYLWLVVASVLLLPVLQLRRERLARRALL